MSLGRLLAALLACAAVLGCATLALELHAARDDVPVHSRYIGAPARAVGERVAPHVVTGQALPLRMRTGRATQVITVVAHSYRSTVATLQRWRKTSTGWVRVGRRTLAHIGSDGMSKSPSEWRSATPVGSFTLTRTFGYRADPGTSMPYLHTRPSDWWISQAGAMYNTHQRCSSGCSFTQGDPNEHLYYERPYYGYAAVIDYNTRNSPTGVRQGAGSAFFLHVTDGSATAGCVAIAQDRMIKVLRWLRPTHHPRILIGVT